MREKERNQERVKEKASQRKREKERLKESKLGILFLLFVVLFCGAFCATSFLRIIRVFRKHSGKCRNTLINTSSRSPFRPLGKSWLPLKLKTAIFVDGAHETRGFFFTGSVNKLMYELLFVRQKAKEQLETHR